MARAGYVIGFDFGLKYIGVALGQSLTGTARGIATLSALEGRPRWADVKKLLGAYQPKTAIVGLPLNMDGSESDMAARARVFAEQLERNTGLTVQVHDERLTSRAAKHEFEQAKALGRADTEHELAACLIVESWLAEQARASAP